MVAAENDALPRGKVGGVGDVVRDVPPAIADYPAFDGRVTVLCPSYGFLDEHAKARLAVVPFRFRGEELQAELIEVEGRNPHPQVRQLILHHHAFESSEPATGRRTIYVDDGAGEPFASDATKFAAFCSATGSALRHQLLGDVDQLHLHDWHTALLLMLRVSDPELAPLNSLPTAFTIHNLALQGIRPFKGDRSSLAEWFPDLKIDQAAISDPEYTDCVNPMAVGIRLSDRVHVVSPTYAEEVCRSSLPKRNDEHCFFFGGEGLEADLTQARKDGRLFGILNGCEYAADRQCPERDESCWQNMLKTLLQQVDQWHAETGLDRHKVAKQRLLAWVSEKRPRPPVVMTSVTRIVDQKVRLMRGSDAADSPLNQILTAAGDSAVYLLAGSGDAGYENFIEQTAIRHPNLIFLNGYSQSGADALYKAGDLFLMPSSFEPCGISQMLAMRDGQPCVVHSIGGLRDTVIDGESGFAFSGRSPDQLEQAFVDCTLNAVRMKTQQPEAFEKIRDAAFRREFLWSDSVEQYLARLYT